MALDPKLLTQIIGGVGGAAGGGGNGFLKGWQRAEQEMQGRQQQASEQQRQQQAMQLQQEQAARLQQQAEQQVAQMRLTAMGKATELLNDPGVYTPQEYERRAALVRNTLADPALGFAPGFLDRALPPAPEITVFQSRIAAKKLSEIQNNPQVKKLIASGQSLDSTQWKVPELGEQPVSFAQLQQMAGGPTPAAPLPSAADAADDLSKSGVAVQAAAALRRGDMEEYNRLLRVQKEIGTADNVPRPANGGVEDARRFSMEQRLLAQWDKANGPFKEMRRQLGLMETGLRRFRAGDKNGGSQAVLVTFQKILDPTSVVRESEYARSSQGVSLMARLEGYADRLAAGGAGVPDAELAEMVETGRQFLAGMEGYNNGLRERIARTAGEYRLDPRLIFDDMAAPAGAAATPGSTPTGRFNPVTGKVEPIQ